MTDLSSAAGLLAWHAQQPTNAPRPNTTASRDVPRVILCVCGWAGRYNNLPATQLAFSIHLQLATTGCDHVARIEDA